MIYKCNTCGILWTTKNTTERFNATKAAVQECPDCLGFEWVNYNKRADYAKSLKLGK